MKHSRIFMLFFVGVISVLSLLTVAGAAPAQETIGRIEELAGRVSLKKADQAYWEEAAQGMEVYFGDSLRTGDDGRCLVRLVDESIIQVRPNSHIVLNTIMSPLEKKNSVLLFFGRIWNKVSEKALRRKVFEVQTPTAVCGVRGTDFETGSYDDGTLLVRVNSGTVEVDNEVKRTTLGTSQGTRVGFGQEDIVAETDYRPDWEKNRDESRENLLSDGEKYGGYVNDEIYRRRDAMKQLVDRAADLQAAKEKLKARMAEAERKGDAATSASLAAEIDRISAEQREVNEQIAYYGRRMECHFGLFSHYGDIAKDPVLSPRFRGREFILNQLDNIDMIRAEFNAMVEEGMKMSMEDMEDMMDEMRDKMRQYKDQKEKEDIFEEMN